MACDSLLWMRNQFPFVHRYLGLVILSNATYIQYCLLLSRMMMETNILIHLQLLICSTDMRVSGSKFKDKRPVKISFITSKQLVAMIQTYFVRSICSKQWCTTIPMYFLWWNYLLFKKNRNDGNERFPYGKRPIRSKWQFYGSNRWGIIN